MKDDLMECELSILHLFWDNLYIFDMWEFKDKNTTETVEKICRINGYCVITVCQARNRFHCDDNSLRDEFRPGYSSDHD